MKQVGMGSPTPGVPAFNVSRHRTGISMSYANPASFRYAAARQGDGLHLDYKPSTGGGWTVYTFWASSSFELVAGRSLIADILRVGGGGSGGCGLEGGGGGGGEVIDLHGQVITAGSSDGTVIVGLGGPEVAICSAAGNRGGDTSFGGVTARGGGYGAGESQGPPAVSYSASDGASGGGGAWNEEVDPEGIEGYTHYKGYGGPALAEAHVAQTLIPYGSGDEAEYWSYVRTVGHADGIPTGSWIAPNGVKCWTVSRTAGHKGGDGNGYEAWYNITDGGGGGAHDPYQRDSSGALLDPLVPYFWVDQERHSESLDPKHGGHGVPCDIRGWHLWEESSKATYQVDWYGGGGAGKERKINWSYTDGRPGFCRVFVNFATGYGSGAANTAGFRGTGGGGGGGGVTGYDSGLVDHPGPAGGSGIVVVRIRTEDEPLVHYPRIVSVDKDPDNKVFGQFAVESEDANCEIRRLPSYMVHMDENGDEESPLTHEEVQANPYH